MSKPYSPPYSLTSAIVSLVARIGEAVGRLSAHQTAATSLRLRRINRIRTIQGSLAIEGNTLSEAQITAILDGKRVIAPPREIQEARNAIKAYDLYTRWQPSAEKDLLAAHGVLMSGLLDAPGTYRSGGVGVMAGDEVIHMAPPASRVPSLMRDLLHWLKTTDEHPLIASSVFHYEFEFIHPFEDGNGRMGRLWQTLILSQWNPLLVHIPVETLIHEHQQEYYVALNRSTQHSDSAAFIEFMLQMILDATPRAQSKAHSRARSESILHALAPEPLSANELIARLNLRSKTGAFKRTIKALLDDGLIEYTLPDKPSSRLQKYRLTGKRIPVSGLTFDIDTH
jgi:Fic family protein